MVLDDEFSTVTFIKEGTIPRNWTYIVQRSSQIGASEYVDPKDTWFNIDFVKDPREAPSNELIAAPENNNKTLKLPHSKLHVQ